MSEKQTPKLTQKEKMQALIDQKKGGGRSKQTDVAKNDRTKIRKGPKIFNEIHW
ncbi:hypothetical protein KNP65_08010 [Latilactobacillus curvatus]|uniref:hypothetical protein n=1 Tax=Latilactobacillus curvatus TaxID=28038 RepID=UPI0024119599|nr:hypothetical protein [Latilactobacillus curvatus]MDG2979891.1 hypothetical protein [Latilactobacillus curvatus]